MKTKQRRNDKRWRCAAKRIKGKGLYGAFAPRKFSLEKTAARRGGRGENSASIPRAGKRAAGRSENVTFERLVPGQEGEQHLGVGRPVHGRHAGGHSLDQREPSGLVQNGHIITKHSFHKSPQIVSRSSKSLSVMIFLPFWPA